MLITGSFSEIVIKLNRYLNLFKESVLVNNTYSAMLTISSNGHNIIMINKNTLREIDDCLIIENELGRDVLAIDEEIFYLFSQGGQMDQKQLKVGCDDCEYKTAAQKAKTVVQKAKIEVKNAKVNPRTIVLSDTTDIKDNNFSAGEQEIKVPILSDEYCIQDHLEESLRLSKPCVFGIKYISENLFALYYRRSVYDKGADTTFRHYLCKQPGVLVAYMYFKELKGLRYKFETLGKKLRHNGQNLLSREQSDYLVHYYTRCWL